MITTAMNISCTVDPETQCLYYETTQTYEFRAAIELFQSVKAQCTQTGYRKAIIDIRPLTNDIPQLDRFKLGKEAAAIWGSTLQVALVGKPELMNNFFETVAVNRMTQVRVFTDPESAYDWLGVRPEEPSH